MLAPLAITFRAFLARYPALFDDLGRRLDTLPLGRGLDDATNGTGGIGCSLETIGAVVREPQRVNQLRIFAAFVVLSVGELPTSFFTEFTITHGRLL